MKPVLFLLIAALSSIQGCQTPQQPPVTPAAQADIQTCRQFLSIVDDAVSDAATTDTAVFRVEGYPYLRTSRFLAGMTPEEMDNGAAVQRWLERMHQLDWEAREKEILNLDNHHYQRLVKQSGEVCDRRDIIALTRECSRRLYGHALQTPDLATHVHKAIAIPDEYRLWRRVVGLYPLMALPVAYASANAFDGFRAWHAMPPEAIPTIGAPVVYRPADSKDDNPIDPKALYRALPRDALGLPQLTPREAYRLAGALAPVMVQDTVAGYDRIGSVQWHNGSVTVTPQTATGYFYYSYGRFDRQPSLQINYVFWYSHRAGDNAPWIERGRLDGLTVRISLDPAGQPVMLDIMNNCGCYHFFVPDHARIGGLKTPFMGLDPLVPAWLPEAFPGNRLSLMVNSGWHQVQHIGTAKPYATGTFYELRPYRELEILPDESGQHRSIFDPEGIVWGSERIEPVLFFAMGIPDIGSMRQRGHHAIKLVGQAHFDQPNLFDETFTYR